MRPYRGYAFCEVNYVQRNSASRDGRPPPGRYYHRHYYRHPYYHHRYYRRY
jgi:hypothetical protein